MYYTIYQTTNLINGKIYIGQHKTKIINDDYLGSGVELKEEIEKYGRENFKKEILFVFDTLDEMKQKEHELVTVEFCLREDTYNRALGGGGGLGKHISPETIRKISQANLGKKLSAETRAKISLARMSKPKSEETRKRMSKPKSEETKRKMAEAAKIREAKKKLNGQ